VDRMIPLAVHLDWRGGSQSQGPLVTRKLLHEMLSKVRGTATPRDQGPGTVCKGESFFPLWFWPPL
jgi:hypothetical protein